MKNKAVETLTSNPFYGNLEKFIIGLNVKMNDYWTRSGFTHSPAPTILIENVGKRYARIASFEDRDGKLVATSVHSFFDLTNGNLLKGSWAAPVANGVRGNVNDPDVLNKFNHYGPNYLRG